MAPTCIGLVMEIIARGSETTENHYDPTGDAALSLPSAASTNPVINLQSDAGPHHTQPFLLAYTFQYHGPVTEAESVLFTIGDRMPTYPGVISHAAAVYAPESLTQQYINEFFARYFSANWVITQDPGAILSYHADTTEAAVAYMQAEAETDIRSRNATSRTAVVTFIEGLEKITIDSLAESSRECSICRGNYGEPVSMNKCLPEHPVRMPCAHVFGTECITLLLSPKPDGWGHRLCPLCRVQIEVPKIGKHH